MSLLTRDEAMKDILIKCFIDDDTKDQRSFFDKFYKEQGKGYFFLFKKNLTVTNIQFAELVALLKNHSSSEGEENVGSKFHFFTAAQFNDTIKELKDSYIIDRSKPELIEQNIETAAKHFAKTYYSLLQHIVVIDSYFTSCSVFIPP